MTNNRKLAFLALLSAGVLGACGTESNSNSSTEEAASSSQEMVSEEQADDTSSESSNSSETASSEASSANNNNQQKGINNQEFSVLLKDAVQLFNEQYPGASIESVQLDDDDDETYEYDIDGFDDANEYELSIDANSGETRDQESGDEDDGDEEALNFENIISPQEAMNIALQEIGSGHVDEWELDKENGTPVYEISIDDVDGDDNDGDITLHAETGEILERD